MDICLIYWIHLVEVRIEVVDYKTGNIQVLRTHGDHRLHDVHVLKWIVLSDIRGILM